MVFDQGVSSCGDFIILGGNTPSNRTGLLIRGQHDLVVNCFTSQRQLAVFDRGFLLKEARGLCWPGPPQKKQSKKQCMIHRAFLLVTSHGVVDWKVSMTESKRRTAILGVLRIADCHWGPPQF